jgi:hypothetical protein
VKHEEHVPGKGEIGIKFEHIFCYKYRRNNINITQLQIYRHGFYLYKVVRNYQQQYYLLVFQSDTITEQLFRPECDHRQAISVHKNTVGY